MYECGGGGFTVTIGAVFETTIVNRRTPRLQIPDRILPPPEDEPVEGNVLTFAWVMLVNVFMRQLASLRMFLFA